MPTYDTPTPIDLAINLQVGAIEVFASDRADTVVTVSPTNPAKAVDRRGAEETKVDFDGQRLTITGPRPRFSWIGPTESVDVKVELPTGSRLTAEIAVGGVRTVGRLGATRIKSSMGPVDVDTTGDLWLRAGARQRDRRHRRGRRRDHGRPRPDPGRHGHRRRDPQGVARHHRWSASPAATSTRSSPTATSRSRRRSPPSRRRPPTAASSCGEVSSGSIQVESGYGQVTIGVRPGVPAWLDLSSKNGRVRNELDGDRAPDASEQTVAVRARTQYGDITIQRAR